MRITSLAGGLAALFVAGMMLNPVVGWIWPDIRHEPNIPLWGHLVYGIALMWAMRDAFWRAFHGD